MASAFEVIASLLFIVFLIGVIYQYDVRYVHMAACSIFMACLFNLEDPEIEDQLNRFSWFAWVKRFSLLLGWFAIIGVQCYPNWNVTLGFVYAILFANVLEASLFSFQHLGIVFGLCSLALCFATPILTVENGLFKPHKNQTIFGHQIFLSPKWYFRLYYIYFGSWHLVSYEWNEAYMLVFLSCFIPLIWSEVTTNEDNICHLFLFRVCFLIYGSSIDTFIYTEFFNLLTFWDLSNTFDLSMSGILIVNGLEFGLITAQIIACRMIDNWKLSREKVNDSDCHAIHIETANVNSIEE